MVPASWVMNQALWFWLALEIQSRMGV